MTAEAVAAYLGIILAGCVVVGIADSFAPASIADRNRIAQAQAIITQDVILRGDKKLPMYARVVAAKSPRAVVIPAARGQALQVQHDFVFIECHCHKHERGFVLATGHPVDGTILLLHT